jgi:hypothetical protein
MVFLHAWYSAKADSLFGHAVYRNENGKEVVLTIADSNPDTGDDRSKYNWEDSVYVGEVVEEGLVRATEDPYKVDGCDWEEGTKLDRVANTVETFKGR